MKRLFWLLDHVLPTLLMTASAALLTAGVLSYAPSAFGDWQTPEPVLGGGDPLFADGSATLPPDEPTPLESLAPTDQPSQPIPTDSEAPIFTPGATATDVPPTPTPIDLPSFATPSPYATPRPTRRPPTEPPDTAPPTQGPTSAPTPHPSQPPTPRPTQPVSTEPASPTPVPTPRPTAAPTPHPTAVPTPRPTAVPGAGYPTRIRIPSLGVDLPIIPSDLVVPGNVDFYPLCDVAHYMVGFVKPGDHGSTYIYAHARAGMFLPLLRTSLVNNGAAMIGALVEVYTSDNKLHLYEIFVVKRHATDLSLTNVPAGVHQLVLQTSEGYAGHVPKLQVAARPIAVVSASYAAAHPTPHPRACVPRS